MLMCTKFRTERSWPFLCHLCVVSEIIFLKDGKILKSFLMLFKSNELVRCFHLLLLFSLKLCTLFKKYMKFVNVAAYIGLFNSLPTFLQSVSYYCSTKLISLS